MGLRLLERETYGIVLGRLGKGSPVYGLAGWALLGFRHSLGPGGDERFAFFRSRRDADAALRDLRDRPGWPFAEARVVQIRLNMEAID